MEHTFIRRSTGKFQKFQGICGILKNWLSFSLETYPLKRAFHLRVFTSCHKPYLGRHFEFLDGKGNECNPAFSTRRTFPPKRPQTFRKWKTPVDLTTKSVDCKTVGFFLKISKEIGKAWRKRLTRAKRATTGV